MLLSIFLLFLTGLIASVLGSLIGLGGGFIIVPVLVTLFHIEPHLVVGTSLVSMLFISLSSVWEYSRQKRIDYKSGLLFAASGVPASIVGAYTAKVMSGHLFYMVFGALMLFVSLSLIFRPTKSVSLPVPHTIYREFVDRQGSVYKYSFNGWIAGSIAFVTGFLSSLFGIGGGSIMVPAMVIFFGFPPHIAGATSMFMILLSAFVGGGTHAILGDVLWGKVLWLAPGAFIGGRIGAWLAPKVSGKWMVRVMASILIVVAVQIATQ